MKKLQATLVCLVAFSGIPLSAQSGPYPFNDPNLPVEKRIDNLLSLMTIDEKVACLGTNTRVQRLGVPNIGSSEGIHGVVQRNPRGSQQPITTTQLYGEFANAWRVTQSTSLLDYGHGQTSGTFMEA